MKIAVMIADEQIITLDIDHDEAVEYVKALLEVEVWHRRTFQPSGLFAARVNLQGTTQGLHALFTGEDPAWEAWLNVDASGFSGIVNLGGNGIKIRRGYAAFPSAKPTQDELCQHKEEEMDDYCSEVRQISCSLYPYFICRALLYAT